VGKEKGCAFYKNGNAVDLAVGLLPVILKPVILGS
jgi:hypothetical protein